MQKSSKKLIFLFLGEKAINLLNKIKNKKVKKKLI